MSKHIETKPIRCWCAIADPTYGVGQSSYHYAPKTLFKSLVDYSKYLLKQVIYMDYLIESASCTKERLHSPVYDQLILTLQETIVELPTPEIAVQSKQIPQELVGLYTKYYTALCKNRYGSQDLLDLLLSPNLDKNSPNVTNGEVELSFLVPYLHTANSGINITEYCNKDENGRLFYANPTILLPSAIHYVDGEYVVVLLLAPVTLSTVYFLETPTKNSNKDILAMLQHMDLSEYTADDILALYLGTDFSEDSTILTPASKDGINRILNCVFYFFRHNGLKVDIHQPLLAKCLAIVERTAPNDIALEMLSIPPTEWTDEHKVAFRRSPLYSNLSTSLVAAIEAAAEDSTDPTTEQASLDVDDSMEDTNIKVESDTTDKLDVVMQLLELAKPEEKFSDFMYRKLLAERMIRVIKNPPASMSKAQVALLKSWLTHWINLVSIASLKSFLNKFQFEFLGIKTYKLIGTNK